MRGEREKREQNSNNGNAHFCYFFTQLRVVTQEDVRFQRFRRDDVGVFELKGMIEKNTERVAAAEQVAADNEDKL